MYVAQPSAAIGRPLRQQRSLDSIFFPLFTYTAGADFFRGNSDQWNERSFNYKSCSSVLFLQRSHIWLDKCCRMRTPIGILKAVFQMWNIVFSGIDVIMVGIIALVVLCIRCFRYLIYSTIGGDFLWREFVLWVCDYRIWALLRIHID